VRKKFDAEKSTLHQRRAHLKPALATLIHGKLVPLPERSAGEFTVTAKRVEADVELQELGAVAIEVACDSFERIQASFFGRHAVAHVFDNGVRASDLDVFFATSGRACRAYVLVAIAASANDG